MASPPVPDKSRDAIGTGVVPNDAWLALGAAEDILEPDLPIVDPHHHLWDHKRHRYLLDELRADTGSGHRIVATVFVDCMAFYRADGPAALRPVGETEFANGVAAMCASGVYGELRACAGIVSHADLTLGADARAVLQAHIATAAMLVIATPGSLGVRQMVDTARTLNPGIEGQAVRVRTESGRILTGMATAAREVELVP